MPKITYSAISAKFSELGLTWTISEEQYANMNSKSKTDFKCSKHNEQWNSAIGLVFNKKKMCKQCRAALPKSNSIDVYAGKQVHLISKLSDSKAKFQCLANLDHVWEESIQNVLSRSYGCFMCKGKSNNSKPYKLDEETVMGKIAMLGFTLHGEFKTTNLIGEFECKRGHVWKTIIHNVYAEKSGCPMCGAPSCEAMCIFILETIFGKKFEKTRKILSNHKELDGYNEELKLAVEYNGAQHYIENRKYFHTKEDSFEKQQERDASKIAECEELGINLIVVSYKLNTFDAIKDYLLEVLTNMNYKNDSDIDWDSVKQEFMNTYDKNRVIFNKIIEKATARGGKCLSTGYSNSNELLLFKCSNDEHPEFSKRGKDILRDVWCNQCAHNAPLDTISDKIVTGGEMLDLGQRKDIVRKRILAHVKSKTITKRMIPIINGVPIVTDAMDSIITSLDPQGVGRDGARRKTESDIADDIKCCKMLSFIGGSGDNQIFICLRTLMIFSRSRDNILIAERRYCPFCRSESSKFAMTDPWAYIPVYTYNPARKTAANPDPLKFIARFDSVEECVKNGESTVPANIASVMDPLRFSLFNCSNGTFAKTDIPKRAVCRKQYVSFYPPKDGKMSETNPDWLLQRRLTCPMFEHMRDTLRKRYSDKRAADNKRYAS